MRPNLFSLEAIFEEFEHRQGMYVLGSSDAKTLTGGELLCLTGESLDLCTIPLSYHDVKGNYDLREEVAASYGISVDQVLITVGASEAIFLSLHTLLGPGDRALVCLPAFQALYEMAQTTGATVCYYHYIEQNGEFNPDLSTVRDFLRGPDPPRLLVLNNPHNPTGHVIDEETLRDLLTEANAVGTTTVVDEVFSGIWLNSTKPVRSGIILNPRTIVIGSLSKVYGLAGLRLGWLVGPPEFIRACKNLRYYTSMCPPAIVQNLGTIALRHREKILERTRQIVKDNYDCALRWLEINQNIFEWIRPQAGLVMLIRLRVLVNTVQFVRDLAESKNVFVLPCTTCFGMREGYLRLGLGGDPGRFEEGLNRISSFILEKR